MLILRIFRKIYFQRIYLHTFFAKIILWLNNVSYRKSLVVCGLLKVVVTKRGKVYIGDNCQINSGPNFNLIGRQGKFIMWVDGILSIGNNVGMSNCTFVCHKEISIGNNVLIGGNVVIYDTDFHSIDPGHRLNRATDKMNKISKEVNIGNNVFIGAHSTILKGVSIGDNSVLGAGSVLTKSIPANQIWGGNPAKFIRDL